MLRLLFLFLVPSLVFGQEAAKKERIILDWMTTACANLKSASFILTTTERVKKGNVEKGEILVKLQHTPLKMYLHMFAPRKGVEILYRHGELNNELYISPNSFPYFNLKLSPNSMLVRESSHHTVPDIGFDYLMKMIGHYQSAFGEKLYDYLAIVDTVQFELRRCVKMEFDYPDFGYTLQTAKKGQSLADIAAKYSVNEYMMVCANPEVEDVYDIKAGQQIRVPNMFGRKIIFHIDLKTMLPLVQEIHDEKGFFEKYEYKSFVFNPVFDPAEFTPEYEGYGF